MDKNQENIVSINGTEYKESEFNDEQKYLLAQVRDLEVQLNTLKMQSDQRQAAYNLFTDQLIASVNTDAKSKIEVVK
tara:strand:- start:600 stop:830 length:231 start_codon:yes stop_codon:yes gene_type:complete